MAFGLPNEGTGEFLPLLSFNAKSGRFSVVDRVETARGWEKQERELKESELVFAFDFQTALKGWLLFRKGAAPVKVLVPIDTPLAEFPACPPGDYGLDDRGNPIRPRPGVLLHCLTTDRVLREFASNAQACLDGLGAAFDAYKAAPEAGDGMVAIVRCTDTKKVGKNQNYQPIFAIEKWIDRPEHMGDGPVAPQPPAPAAPRPTGGAMGMPQGQTPTARALSDAIPFAPETR